MTFGSEKDLVSVVLDTTSASTSVISGCGAFGEGYSGFAALSD
jgi:hypothetical protein